MPPPCGTALYSALSRRARQGPEAAGGPSGAPYGRAGPASPPVRVAAPARAGLARLWTRPPASPSCRATAGTLKAPSSGALAQLQSTFVSRHRAAMRAFSTALPVAANTRARPCTSAGVQVRLSKHALGSVSRAAASADRSSTRKISRTSTEAGPQASRPSSLRRPTPPRPATRQARPSSERKIGYKGRAARTST